VIAAAQTLTQLAFDTSVTAITPRSRFYLDQRNEHRTMVVRQARKTEVEMSLSSKTLLTATLAFTVTAIAAAAVAKPSSKYVCKGIYLGVGAANSKSDAKHQAIGDWTTKVIAALGSAWGHWKIAAGKKVECEPKSNGPHWQCVAQARPCIWKSLDRGVQPKPVFVPPSYLVPRHLHPRGRMRLPSRRGFSMRRIGR
jgi:hypothetical protein